MKRNNSHITKPKYYSWKTDLVRCKQCTWNGTGKEAIQGDPLDEGFFLNCPKCHKEFISYIEYPSLEEIKLYGSHNEKADAIEREKFWNEYKKEKLKSANQIKDIDSNEIILYWDKSGEDQLILHDNNVIWKEAALYESFQRYIAIGRILKEKFGSRLKDLVPTENSELYLYGDKLRSVSEVKKFRDSL